MLKGFKRLVGVLAVLLLLGGAVTPVLAATVEELQEKLKSQRETLNSVEDRIKKFKEDIQIKKKEARTLADQIEIIEDGITEIRLTIDQTVAEIETTNGEIEAVLEEIKQKEEEIEQQKELLGEYLRSIYELNRQSSVTVFLKYSTFSEAVNEASTIEELQKRGQQALVAVKHLRDELQQKESNLNEFKGTLEALQRKQEGQQATLVATQQSKERILELTNAQEAEFASLLDEARKAHLQAESDIKRLDTQIREELRKQGLSKLPSVGIMDWPVEAIFGVSCEFHCSGYPYAYLIGPHSGMDIPTYVGTPILAPAEGFVARAYNAGGPGYSYILLLHGDNVSTVYGHVSGFNVTEGEIVPRGSIIGYTGGASGTTGAGLSTGPHLHFEVRQNNVPINPRKYL